MARKRIVRIAAALLLLQMTASACSDDSKPPPPDVPFLSSDGYFSIGGHRIVVPMVALRGPDHVFTLTREKPAKSRKEILQEQATNPDHPMIVDSLDLAIRQYQYTGEYGISMTICPRLTRLWAQLMCRGEHTGVLQHLPERFDLLDRAKLDILKTHSVANGRTKYDRVSGMALRLGDTEIACEQSPDSCTAVVETQPGLLAVWTVWSSEGETAEHMAQRQGPAIVEFVRRGIGPIEDKTLATAQ
jgi:hypothetical protein